MTNPNHNRLCLIFSLSLLAVLLFSACAPMPAEEPAAPGQVVSPGEPVVTEPPPAPEQPALPDNCRGGGDAPLICSFLQEDGSGYVDIELPWQGRRLEIIARGFEEDLDPSIPLPEYISQIKYIQVIDPNIDPNTGDPVVHDFAPPLVMTAQYTDRELSELEDVGYDPEYLVIGIYDHDIQEFKIYKPEINPEMSTGTIWVEHWTSHACWIRSR